MRLSVTRYLIFVFPVLLISCEKMPEYQIPVILEPEYTYVPPQHIPELDRHGYLMFNTKAVSKIPLHKVYDENRFHYAHFKCPMNDQFEVTGSISVDDSEYNPIVYKNNHYKYDVLFTICPENDASKLNCVYTLEQLKTLPQQLSCKITFGRMFGGSAIIAKNIHMDISQLALAKQYKPPTSENIE